MREHKLHSAWAAAGKRYYDTLWKHNYSYDRDLRYSAISKNQVCVHVCMCACAIASVFRLSAGCPAMQGNNRACFIIVVVFHCACAPPSTCDLLMPSLLIVEQMLEHIQHTPPKSMAEHVDKMVAANSKIYNAFTPGSKRLMIWHSQPSLH